MDERVMDAIDNGTVKISNEVLGVIASLAIKDTEGIVGISSGIVEGFTNMLGGKKNLHKGIKVSMVEERAVVDLNVTVAYGVKIHEVSANAQQNVKNSIESMTGIEVESVNIYVQDVVVPEVEEVEVEKEEE